MSVILARIDCDGTACVESGDHDVVHPELLIPEHITEAKTLEIIGEHFSLICQTFYLIKSVQVSALYVVLQDTWISYHLCDIIFMSQQQVDLSSKPVPLKKGKACICCRYVLIIFKSDNVLTLT